MLNEEKKKYHQDSSYNVIVSKGSKLEICNLNTTTKIHTI